MGVSRGVCGVSGMVSGVKAGTEQGTASVYGLDHDKVESIVAAAVAGESIVQKRGISKWRRVGSEEMSSIQEARSLRMAAAVVIETGGGMAVGE